MNKQEHKLTERSRQMQPRGAQPSKMQKPNEPFICTKRTPHKSQHERGTGKNYTMPAVSIHWRKSVWQQLRSGRARLQPWTQPPHRGKTAFCNVKRRKRCVYALVIMLSVSNTFQSVATYHAVFQNCRNGLTLPRLQPIAYP